MKIPSWIMGYSTMALGLTLSLQRDLLMLHFIQAGVGSLAGAMVGYFCQQVQGRSLNHGSC